ncbi:putative F-box domain-containing protein [Helianthus annuus]|nr:putative F-box domain-containing protein [Helianthus annuus]
MEDCVLPENPILEVLSRLLVKTITRFKCVCKKWRDLVSDTYFIDLHLSRSPSCLMIHQYVYPGPILELIEVDHEVDYHRLTLDHVKSLNLHLTAVRFHFLIIQVGSVNGLICLLSHRFDVTCIFNPVVKEYVILPQPPHSEDIWSLSYGFRVSMAGEYKVISLRCGWTKSENHEAELTVEIEIYTLGTDQWRRLGQIPYNVNYSGDMDSGVFVNSHVYWIDDAQVYDFDLNTETFELFPSPTGGTKR